MSEYVLISDIHGNAPSLQKVVDREGLNAKYVVLGDIHGLNAYPQETVNLLNKIETKVLLAGNHDRAIFQHNEGHVNNDALSRFELEHTKANLTPAQQGWLNNLPFMEVWKNGDNRIAAAHAKPWPAEASGYESGNAGVPKGNIPHFASKVADDYDMVFLGHTHEQFSLDAERWGHPVQFVNPGSLGWQQEYAVIYTETGNVSLKRVESTDDEVEAHLKGVLPPDAPHTQTWF